MGERELERKEMEGPRGKEGERERENIKGAHTFSLSLILATHVENMKTFTIFPSTADKLQTKLRELRIRAWSLMRENAITLTLLVAVNQSQSTYSVTQEGTKPPIPM